MTESEVQYRQLCNHFINQSVYFDLWQLKEIFKDFINSQRRLENIHSFAELIKVLEKRDVLNQENVQLLRTVAQVVNRADLNLMQVLDTYCNGFRTTSNFIAQESPPVLPNLTIEPRTKIKKLIASEIGLKWKELARALNVREGKIDELEKKHNNDISEIVHEVLNYHEHQADQRYWRSNLLEALREARRNDLRLEVQKIMDIHLI